MLKSRLVFKKIGSGLFLGLLASASQSCLLYMAVTDSPVSALSASAVARNCSPLDSTITSWWDGDHNTALTCSDVITGGSANDGTMTASVVGSAGKVGNAFSLNGTDANIAISDANSLDLTTGLTISAWVNSNTASQVPNRMQTILSKWGFNTGAFSTGANWTGLDISAAGIFNNAFYRSYKSAVFDGRYVYFVPFNNGGANSDAVARYDTRGSITDVGSWSGVQVGSAAILNNTVYKSFSGAVFDGRYVYFIPYNSFGSPSGNIARYDTQGTFTAAGSWSGVDISSAGILNNAVYRAFFGGGVFDGRYLYLVPTGNSNSGSVARYDTQGTFSSAASWSGVNFAGAAILNNAAYVGFNSGIFDGRYVYFIPRNNGSGSHGNVVRYDTQGAFSAAGSWSAINIAGATIFNNILYTGFAGATFDGRYLYLAPRQYFTGSWNDNGNVVRYDTQASFTSAASWTAIDISSAGILNDAGYAHFSGAIFDGRFVYFPKAYGSKMARYDTQGAFTQAASWSGADIASAGILNDGTYSGYTGGTFDGRYIYLAPGGTGKVVRYDTVGTQGSYLLNFGSAQQGDGSSASLPGMNVTVNTVNGPLSVSMNSTVTASAWHHIAATYDNTNLKLYVDGALVGTQPGTGSLVNSSSSLVLGSQGGGAGYFNGLLDEVQIYSSALTASQIAAIHTAGAEGVCK